MFLELVGTQGFYVSNYGGAVYLPTDIAHSGGAGTFDIQVRNYRLGTSTGGDISIYPKHGTNSLGLGTSSYQNRFFINGVNGNVGIGTTSPSKILHIYDGTYNLQIDGNELFHSDSNPFYIKSADSIIIQPSQSTTATFTSTGVGIGTTTPQRSLHLQSSSANYLRLETTGDTGAGMEFMNDNGRYTIGVLADDSFGIYKYSQFSGGYALRIQAGGVIDIPSNVGIGTTAPTEKLHVNGNIRIADNSNLVWSGGTRIVANANYLRLQTGSQDVLNLDSNQRVGIGTTSPEEKLSINNGRIQLSNQYMLTFSDIGDGNSGRVGIQGDEDNDFLRFRTDNQNRMAITNTGVGIGTLSPVYGLDVRSTGYFATASTTDQLRLGDTTNGTTSSIRSVNDTMHLNLMVVTQGFL